MASRFRADETSQDWVRIRTAYDYPGWIRPEDLAPATRLSRPALSSARRYFWGGLTERAIDCSGLVHIAYRRLGRLVPRDADQREAVGTSLSG